MSKKNLACAVIILALIFTIAAGQNNYMMKGDQARLAPRLLNYQGFLTDTLGNPITNPSSSMTFTIFDAVSAGSQKWTESQLVSVDKGIFHVLLGSVTSIPDSVFTNSNSRWLELTVAGQILTPRTQIVSSPYSYTSTYSDTAIYARNSAPDNDWSFRITDIADTTLQMGGRWGLTRAGNVLYGNADSTHVNFGVVCTTGTTGHNNKYCTVGGGGGNVADTTYTTVAGGQSNIASGYAATVGGGYSNQADSAYAFIGGGYNNTASAYAVIGGGYINTASGNRAFVGAGGNNSASGSSSTVGGGNSNAASGTFAFVGGGAQNIATSVASTVAGGEYNIASGDMATVGGGLRDTASGYRATVGGGENNSAESSYTFVGGGYFNTASHQYATVSGGCINTASGYATTIAGGYADTAMSIYSGILSGYSNLAGNETADTGATVAGGYDNSANSKFSIVSGGRLNRADSIYTTVSGGYADTANGYYATVPGGIANKAAGNYSFVAGRRAKANNQGCFVWGDATDANVSASVDNRWVARCSGGVYFYTNSSLSSGVYVAAGGNSWSAVSDRNMKENFQPVDGSDVLLKLMTMPITTWNYKSQDPSIRHIGPMAQDFAGFGVGEDDKHITTIDADGIALAAIKELAKQVQELKEENKELQKEIQILKNK
jgi:hypothetical protein